MSESLFTVQTPAITDASDGTPGISFATSVEFATAGTVSAVRFFSTVTISGTYTGELWRVDSDDTAPSGTLLASQVLGAPPVSGDWNIITFGAPVAVTINTLYRAVVHSGAGRYVATANMFTGTDIVNGNITGWQNGSDPVGLGSLRQGTFAISAAAGVYPSSPGNGTSYFADVVFDTGVTPSEVELTPAVLTFAAVPLAPSALPVTVALTSAVATFTAVPLTPSALPVTVPLTPAVVSFSAPALSPAGATVTLTPAVISFSAPALSPEPAGGGEDTLLLPEAALLLECLEAALLANPNPPLDICLRAGDHVVQDVGIPGFSRDSCCRGQAYVRIVGFYMTGGDTTPFPSPSTDAPLSPCGIPAWGLQLEMGIFRCVRTDRSLTCTEWGVAMAQQMTDAKAMRAALCCFEALHDPSTVAVGTWSPAGPDGGCIGSTWPVSVEVLNCGEDC